MELPPVPEDKPAVEALRRVDDKFKGRPDTLPRVIQVVKYIFHGESHFRRQVLEGEYAFRKQLYHSLTMCRHGQQVFSGR